MWRIITAALLLISSLLLHACGEPATIEHSPDTLVLDALGRLGLGSDTLSLPKLPYPVSTRARLALVDRVMDDPLQIITIVHRLLDLDLSTSHPDYLTGLLEILDQKPPATDTVNFGSPTLDQLLGAMLAEPNSKSASPPPAWSTGSPAALALRTLLDETSRARLAWLRNGGNPAAEEVTPILAHIGRTLTSTDTALDPHRVLLDTYHAVGARQHLNGLNSALLRLLAAAVHSQAGLKQAPTAEYTGEWQTPLGRVLVAGPDDDEHTGEYLLLIDLGGNDTYRNVAESVQPGNVSVVIDLSGDDTVMWNDVQGPGAGLLGLALWLDLEGNDTYRGNSQGLGAGLLGAGLFLDAGGNDSYEARSLSLGAGQYGTGIFIDTDGNDQYVAALHAQGYGGPGGIGILLDRNGDDSYHCEGIFPDPTERRVERHDEKHFISMCQGYAFGLRDNVSGGIGLLMDHHGNDEYSADIFAQGAAYWFGLGILVDGAGNDHYQAFEHAQGEGLHLAAGVLADMAGNDAYSGYEHVQGVGVDRSAGILYDQAGDDNYRARRQSQGAGLKSFGVGLLFERSGNDTYEALIDAQGYSGKPEPGFPDSEWPTGILLDLAGTENFILPYTAPVDAKGRIQNRQGIAIDYATFR
jgi:hypothetical protein